MNQRKQPDSSSLIGGSIAKKSAVTEVYSIRHLRALQIAVVQSHTESPASVSHVQLKVAVRNVNCIVVRYIERIYAHSSARGDINLVVNKLGVDERDGILPDILRDGEVDCTAVHLSEVVHELTVLDGDGRVLHAGQTNQDGSSMSVGFEEHGARVVWIIHVGRVVGESTALRGEGGGGGGGGGERRRGEGEIGEERGKKIRGKRYEGMVACAFT